MKALKRRQVIAWCDIQRIIPPTFTPRGTVGMVLQRLWRLPTDLARRFVVAQADEGRRRTSACGAHLPTSSSYAPKCSASPVKLGSRIILRL